MGYWAIIIILVGSIIGIIVYYSSKTTDMKKEIVRLRKSMVSSGLNFEQSEYRIEDIRDYIGKQKDLVRLGSYDKKEIEDCLVKIDLKLEVVKKELFSRTSKN